MMSEREVRIRTSKYEELRKQAEKEGVSVEELVDRAVSAFIEHEQYVNRMRTQAQQFPKSPGR